MLPIGKSIKILLSLLLSISFSFPLKSEASTKKRSHIYREAIQTLMSGNAQIEKVLVVVAQDKNEIVTTKLRELNIELDKVSSKKASGDLKEIIFKVLAEEYINARKVELVEFSSYIENSRMNPEQKKYVLKDEIERQAQELQRDIEYFRTNVAMDSNALGARITVASIFGALAVYSFHLMSLAAPLSVTFLGSLLVITLGAVGLFSSYIASLQAYDFTTSRSISESSMSNMKQLEDLKIKSKKLILDLEKYKNTHSEMVLP